MGFDFFCVLSTGLKAPTATNHNTAKTTAASQTAVKTASSTNQGLVKQASQYPLQRSGSARLSRLNSTGKHVWQAVCWWCVWVCESVTSLCAHIVFWQGETLVCNWLQVCHCLKTASIPGFLATATMANTKALSQLLYVICVYWRVWVHLEWCWN